MTKVLLTMLRYQLLTMPSLILLSCILVDMMLLTMLGSLVLSTLSLSILLCIGDSDAAGYAELSGADYAGSWLSSAVYR